MGSELRIDESNRQIGMVGVVRAKRGGCAADAGDEDKYIGSSKRPNVNALLERRAAGLCQWNRMHIADGCFPVVKLGRGRDSDGYGRSAGVPL